MKGNVTADQLRRLQVRLALSILEDHVHDVRIFASHLTEDTDVPTRDSLRIRLAHVRKELGDLINDVNELEF